MPRIDPNTSVAVSLLDAVVDAILVIDETLQLKYANRATRDVLGLEDADLDGDLDVFEAIHPDDLHDVYTRLSHVIDGSLDVASAVFRVRHPDSKHGYKPVEATATAMFDDPDIAGVVVTFRDFETILESQQVVESMTETLNRAYDYVVVHSSDGHVLYANELTKQHLGWSGALPTGEWPYDGPLATAIMTEAFSELVHSGSWSGEFETTVNGSEVMLSLQAVGRPMAPVPGVSPGVVIGLGTSVGRRQPVDGHDTASLGIGKEELHRRLNAWRVDRGPVVVMFVELGGLQRYIDDPGVVSAVNVTWLATSRIRRRLGPTGVTFRTGVETFVVVVEADDTSSTDDVAATIVRTMSDGLTLPDGDLRLQPRVGVVVSDGSDLGEPLRHARLACAALREDGVLTGFRTYEPSVEQRLVARRTIERIVRSLVDDGEVFALFQPIVNIIDGAVIGAEALARANVDGVPLPPDEFIEVAERIGVVHEIDTLVLRAAAYAATNWSPSLSVAVNVSAQQLLRPDLVDVIGAILDETGLLPERLELELTERNLYLDMGAATAALHAVRSLGVRIALDDFGTGYSSLTHLAAFPVESIKIDRSFLTPGGNRAIIDAIVQLSKSLDMTTVAEGVETATDLAYLRTIGCQFGQGFYYSRAVTADAIRAMTNLSPTD